LEIEDWKERNALNGFEGNGGKETKRQVCLCHAVKIVPIGVVQLHYVYAVSYILTLDRALHAPRFQLSHVEQHFGALFRRPWHNFNCSSMQPWAAKLRWLPWLGAAESRDSTNANSF
jgi:hypothetical protein